MLQIDKPRPYVRRWAVLGLCGVAALIAIYGSRVDDPTTSIVQQLHSARVNDSSLLRDRNDVVLQEIRKTSRLHRLNLNIPGSVSVGEVLSDPPRFIELANHGNDEVAVALFTAVEGCFPISVETPRIGRPRSPIEGHLPAPGQQGCSRLPAELVMNRLEILRPGLENGNPDAELIYAASLARIYLDDPFAMGQHLNSVDEIRRTSEALATEAARRGLRDAFEFLAFAYLDDSYGFRDVSRAYAYLSALQELDGAPEYGPLMQQLKMRLSESEAATAAALQRQVAARCCSP